MVAESVLLVCGVAASHGTRLRVDTFETGFRFKRRSIDSEITYRIHLPWLLKRICRSACFAPNEELGRHSNSMITIQERKDRHKSKSRSKGYIRSTTKRKSPSEIYTPGDRVPQSVLSQGCTLEAHILE